MIPLMVGAVRITHLVEDSALLEARDPGEPFLTEASILASLARVLL